MIYTSTKFHSCQSPLSNQCLNKSFWEGAVIASKEDDQYRLYRHSRPILGGKKSTRGRSKIVHQLQSRSKYICQPKCYPLPGCGLYNRKQHRATKNPTSKQGFWAPLHFIAPLLYPPQKSHPPARARGCESCPITLHGWIYGQWMYRLRRLDRGCVKWRENCSCIMTHAAVW